MMKKILFLIISCLAGAYSLSAQDVSFKATAPQTVVVGQSFRIYYTLTNAEGLDLKVPEFTGLEVQFGPVKSENRVMMNINGQQSTQITEVYTYTVIARKEGTFDYSPATIKIRNSNSEYKSNVLKIKVLPQDKGASGSATNPNAQSQSGSNDDAGSNVSVSANDIFVRMIVSKNTVYENEGFLVTFKLYSARNFALGSPLKFPEFEGFIVQEIDLPQNQQLGMENYNGRNYQTAILKQVYLYPQHPGSITIGKGEYEFIVQIPTKQKIRSFFDDFFETYTNVKKLVVSSPATINVKPLPAGKPANFTGALGDYKMTTTISSQKVKANEGITIKVNISGTGNLKLIKNPEIKFPNDFEVYDPKVDLNTKITAGGVSGTKTIEYLAIPRYAGEFVVPSAEFSYFDIKSGLYKTLSTPEYKLQIEKGEGGNAATQQMIASFTNKEDVKYLGQDIRYIKTGNVKFTPKGEFFFGTISYYLWYLIPALLFIVFFILNRKKAKENANIALVRTKKANKVAGKRLKLANKLLKENKKEAFYEEILRALWGYLSDKLNIPVASLTKENVENELIKYGVNESLIKEFMNILNTCEFARFAPAQSSEEMDKIYELTTQSIDKMENTIKK